MTATCLVTVVWFVSVTATDTGFFKRSWVNDLSQGTGTILSNTTSTVSECGSLCVSESCWAFSLANSKCSSLSNPYQLQTQGTQAVYQTCDRDLCEEVSNPWSSVDLTQSNLVPFLDQQSVTCTQASPPAVLGSFALEADGDASLRYNYSCCVVPFATANVKQITLQYQDWGQTYFLDRLRVQCDNSSVNPPTGLLSSFQLINNLANETWTYTYTCVEVMSAPLTCLHLGTAMADQVSWDNPVDLSVYGSLACVADTFLAAFHYTTFYMSNGQYSAYTYQCCRTSEVNSKPIQFTLACSQYSTAADFCPSASVNNARYLDRHNVSCLNQTNSVLQTFSLNEINNSTIKYTYKCCQLPAPNTCSAQTTLTTPTLDLTLPDQPNGNANGLQLLNVDCGHDALLQQFQLYSVNGTIVEYYQYTCCNVSTPLYCKTIRTEPQDSGSYDAMFLAGLQPTCPFNTFLQQFLLVNLVDLNQYLYTCCGFAPV